MITIKILLDIVFIFLAMRSIETMIETVDKKDLNHFDFKNLWLADLSFIFFVLLAVVVWWK